MWLLAFQLGQTAFPAALILLVLAAGFVLQGFVLGPIVGIVLILRKAWLGALLAFALWGTGVATGVYLAGRELEAEASFTGKPKPAPVIRPGNKGTGSGQSHEPSRFGFGSFRSKRGPCVTAVKPRLALTESV